MTRSERERQIERYISGGMSPAEEQDFFIQAALDKELRLELKALVTVDSAIRKDREAEPSEHTALRSRVAAMLAAAPPAQDPAASAVPRPTAPAAGVPATGAIPKILPIQWISLAAATIALTAVLFLLLNRPAAPEIPSRYEQTSGQGATIQSQRQQQAPAPLPAASTKEAAPAPSVHAAGSSGAGASRQSSPAMIHSEPDAPSATAPRSTSEPSVSRRESNRSSAASPSKQAESIGSRQSQPPTTSLTEEEEDLGTLPPTKRRGDSLEVKVHIKVNKKQQP